MSAIATAGRLGRVPIEMLGKLAQAFMQGTTENMRMQALGPDYKERQRESGERSAHRRAQLELAKLRTEQASQPRQMGIKQIDTPEGTRFLDLDTMQFVGPTIPLPPEAEPTGSFTFEDTAEGIRAGNRQTGELSDVIGQPPPPTPRQPKEYKPPDYQGRATGILKSRLVDGDASMDDLGELARQLEETDRFGGPPQTVGEYLERPGELSPQPGLMEGVQADPLAQGDGKSLAEMLAAAAGGGDTKPADPDAAAVTVRSKEEALALREGQVFQVEGKPGLYVRGAGNLVEKVE